MNKKDLKMYEAPACEVVEMKLQGVLCGSAENVHVDPLEDGGDI